MSRNISSSLKTELGLSSLNLATCVHVVTLGGIEFGFTSASEPLVISGLTYFPSDGVDSTAIESSTGLSPDNLELAGIIRDDRISEDDLRGGKFDGAKVSIFRVNWSDLSMGSLLLFRGRFGDITYQDGKFHVELRSLTDLLRVGLGEVTSATCRCKRLGDDRCKVSLAAFRSSMTILGVPSPRQIVVSGDGHAAGWYSFGTFQVVAGLHTGFSADIKVHEIVSGEVRISFRQDLDIALVTGDQIELEAGCDRTFATCKAKFSNAANFRGEPLLPGNDTVMQFGMPNS